jgi:broad specificity phosphatase PhoE
VTLVTLVAGKTLIDSIAQYIEESIRDHQDQSPKSKHIAVVAHGIFNSEFLGALIARLKGKRQIGWIYTGEYPEY